METPPPLPPAEALLASPQTLTVPTLRRGPMYSAYAELRELKIRSKLLNLEEEFQLTPIPKKTAVSPAVLRSVPNLSAAMRKENRRPAASPLPPKSAVMMKTPPPSFPSASSILRRSGSVPSGKGEERRKMELKARKSYACLKELNSSVKLL